MTTTITPDTSPEVEHPDFDRPGVVEQFHMKIEGGHTVQLRRR